MGTTHNLGGHAFLDGAAALDLKRFDRVVSLDVPGKRITVQSGITSWDKIPDLGEVVAGKAPGRRSPQEITVFKQNSDQGVGFMALAKLAHDKARAAVQGGLPDAPAGAGANS